MSKIIDTRDLQERLDELEGFESIENDAKDELEEAKKALELLKEGDEGYEAASTAVEDAEAELESDTMDEDDRKELEELREIADEVGSEFRHGETLIPEGDFVDYCRDMLEDCGDLPKDLPSYIVIDWDATSENLKADYSTIDYQGETYYYRCC